MDYRNLFGIAAIILSGAVFVHSLKSANAFPQGPNVSMGSNPIQSFNETCNWTTIISNTTNQTFIITDVIPSYGSSDVDLREGNSSGTHLFSLKAGSVANLRTGVPIPPNTDIVCQHGGGHRITITGYYTH